MKPGVTGLCREELAWHDKEVRWYLADSDDPLKDLTKEGTYILLV